MTTLAASRIPPVGEALVTTTGAGALVSRP